MHTVFVDKIGNIFRGDESSAKENFEKYKELSSRGIGCFANKDVYVLDDNRNVLMSYGKRLFANGGVMTNITSSNLINDFLIGKEINNNEILKSGFLVFQSDESSTLMYNQDGEKPLIRVDELGATFYANSFPNNDIIKNMLIEFKKVCVENAIKFNIN